MSSSGGGGGSGNGDMVNLHDPDLELIDPTPDIHALFAHFNKEFFSGALGAVTVEWSSRMTSCAGLCYYLGRRGGCRIKLSKPLLTLRPRTDLVDTLLHEMIHAYFFVKNGFTRLDRDGHGPDFQQYMKAINEAAGTKITVYHTFHDEVDHHRRHWWKCTGPCVTRPPFFGIVKRAMNRAPGPNDLWWSEHQASCSGSFVKIKEPEKPVKVAKRRLPGGATSLVGSGAVVGGGNTMPMQPITKFFTPANHAGGVASASSSSHEITEITDHSTPMSVDDPITLSDSDDDDIDSDLRKAIALSLGSSLTMNGQSSSSGNRPSTSNAATASVAAGGGGPSTSRNTQVYQSVPFPQLRPNYSNPSTTSSYNFPGVGHRLGS